MMSDPLGDMLARIKNGYLTRSKNVEIPLSNVKLALATLLNKYGFVGEITKDNGGKKFSVKLNYKNNTPAIAEIKRISKPGLRRYVKVRDLESMKQGLGYLILSTPKGLMTHVEAKKSKFGGEILCKVW